MSKCIDCKHYQTKVFFNGGGCLNIKNPQIDASGIGAMRIINPHNFGCIHFEQKPIQVYMMEFKDATDSSPPPTLRLMEIKNPKKFHYVCHAGKIPIYTVDKRAVGKLADRIDFDDEDMTW